MALNRTKMAFRIFDRRFLDHPRSAGQSYVEHLVFAHRFGGRMLLGALAAFVHGLLPSVYESAASDAVRALHASLHRRGD